MSTDPSRVINKMARKDIFADSGAAKLTGTCKRGWPTKRLDAKPIAPFEPNPEKAVAQAFDRETGNPSISPNL